MLAGFEKEGIAFAPITEHILKALVCAGKIPVGLRDIIDSILTGAYGKAYMSLASLLINHNVTLHQDTLEVEKVIYNVWLKEKSTRKRKDGTIVDDTPDADTPDVNLSGEVVELTA